MHSEELSRQPGAARTAGAAGRCSGFAVRSWLGPGRDSLAAVFLGRHVSHRLGELPAVAGQVFDGAFPFAVLPVGGWLEHPGPVGSGPLVPGLDVVNPNLHHVGHDALLWRLLLTADVSHDHRPVLADAHLRPVTLADPGPLREAKRPAQPRHRLPYVRVDEHGDDRGRRNGPVGLHLSLHSSPRGEVLADLPWRPKSLATRPGSQSCARSTGWASAPLP